MQIDEKLQQSVYHYIGQIDGWSTPEKCIKIMECIFDSKSDRSLDIGIYGGRSLISMAFAHRHMNHGYATGLDTWLKETALEGTNDPENDKWWSELDLMGIYRNFLNHVNAHNLHEWLHYYRLSSARAYSLFLPSEFGVIHQDGNHSEEMSLWEVQNYTPFLKQGGYLICDDVSWHTVEASQKWLKSHGFKEEYERIDKVNAFRIWKKP